MKKYISILLALALLLAGSALAAARPVGLMQVGSTLRAGQAAARLFRRSVLLGQAPTRAWRMVKGGVLGGVGEGTAVITASAGGKSAQLRRGGTAREREPEARRNAQPARRDGWLKYAAEDTRIARVSDGGVIGGVAAGSTRIGVKYGRQTMFIQVNVTDEQPYALRYPHPDSRAHAGRGARMTNDVSNLDCATTAEQIVLVRYQSGSKAELSVHQKTDGVWDELFCLPRVCWERTASARRARAIKRPQAAPINLSQPFGIKDDPGAKLPYTKVTEDHLLVRHLQLALLQPPGKRPPDGARGDRERREADQLQGRVQLRAVHRLQRRRRGR